MSVAALEAEWVAVDFETTGVVKGYPSEPWQIGMVRVAQGKVVEVFESYLRVGERPFSPYAPGRYSEVREELAVAPKLVELWPDLQKWWLGVPLVGHNVSVERKIMSEAAPLHSMGPWVDTLGIARKAFPSMKSHALEGLCEELNLADRVQEQVPEGRVPHDALYDAVACSELLLHLLRQEGWRELTFDQLAHL